MVVLDWSGARPNPAQVAAVSHGALRYLGDGRLATQFNLTVAERDALHAAGVPIGLVWEREARRMDEGGGTGERDARVANRQADALGWPLDRPIYFACDDRNGGSPAHVAYVEAARNVSPRPVGVYGPGNLLAQVTVRYKWAVRTWPGFTGGYQLVQEPNIPPPIPQTDVNTAAGDWGGWLPVGASSGMPTGAELGMAASMFHGEPYSTAPGRTSPTSGYKDCSGLMVASLGLVGINPGATVSTTLERWAIANGGRYLSRAEALTTPYCFCTIGGAADGWTGLGPRGHIGFSMGDGAHVYETPSDEGRRVGVSRFDRNRWTGFCTIPGISHHGTTEEDDVKGTFYRDQANNWLYLLVNGVMVPVYSDAAADHIAINGQSVNNRDSAKANLSNIHKKFPVYGGIDPPGFPQASAGIEVGWTP